MNREAIATDLFTQLQTAGSTFKLYSRRPQMWDNCPAYPALYMGNTNEALTYSGQSGSLALNELYYPIGVYFNAGLDPNVIPDTILNNLLDAIDTALAPAPYLDQQTLGGLVCYARREGAVERKPGYLDGQGEAWFQIKVLSPN